jgi:non-homologous end joining protein Ku
VEVDSVDDRDRDALREHFDGADLSDAVDAAVWNSDVESDPMIVTSVRLPKSLLDWVRDQAAVDQVKPTALIRRWIEDRRRSSNERPATADDDAVTRLAERVSRLEAVALRVVAADDGAGADGMTDLLVALQRSVDDARRRSAPPPSKQERRGA